MNSEFYTALLRTWGRIIIQIIIHVFFQTFLSEGKAFQLETLWDNFLAQFLYCVANGFNKYSSFLSDDKQQYCSIVRQRMSMSMVSRETEKWTSLGSSHTMLTCAYWLLEALSKSICSESISTWVQMLAPCKKLSMAMHGYYKRKMGSFWFRERPCLRGIKEGVAEKVSRSPPLATFMGVCTPAHSWACNTHMHTHKHTHTCIHTLTHTHQKTNKQKNLEPNWE